MTIIPFPLKRLIFNKWSLLPANDGHHLLWDGCVFICDGDLLAGSTFHELVDDHGFPSDKLKNLKIAANVKK